MRRHTARPWSIIAGIALIPAQGIQALVSAMDKLRTAVNAGATDLYDQVTSESSECPAEHFVIAGFSQGATVL
ncbi:MAG TPA: cutinase family protein [Streptosporangiaceae bacterium]|nr:cutinase family protein [Streptosporangiaceae bacterium]